MPTSSALLKARDLSVNQRAAFESLLGRVLEEDEVVSVRVSKGEIVSEGLTGTARDAFGALWARIDAAAQRVTGVPEDEVDAALDEAVEYVRHHRE